MSPKEEPEPEIDYLICQLTLDTQYRSPQCENRESERSGTVLHVYLAFLSTPRVNAPRQAPSGVRKSLGRRLGT